MSAPPFPYYGGKTLIAQQIADALPGHSHYVEPFAGSLSVLLAKPRSRMETVNDLDGDLVLFWRVLRDKPDELRRLMDLTPHSRAEHEASYDLDSAPTDLERARRVWVRLTQGRGGLLRQTGWRFYCRTAVSSSMPDYLVGYARRVPDVAERIQGVSLENRPAIDVIAAYGQHADALLYCDPPYLGSTRGWGNQYRHELRADDQHRDLAEALTSCASAVVLSGYPSPLYDDLYKGWHRREIATTTGNGGGDRDRTEVLWSNRPFPADVPSLFDDEVSA